MSNYGEYRSKEDKGILILIYQAFIHLIQYLTTQWLWFIIINDHIFP